MADTCETENFRRPNGVLHILLPTDALSSHRVPNGAVKSEAAKEAVQASSAGAGRLLWWDECPSKLQFNRYIASNVWLHFAPAFCVMIALVEWVRIKEHPHRAAFFSVLVPELCCLLLSTSYHLFMAQVKHYDFWLKFDICGVFGVMVVPYWASVWWGYRCQPTWRVIVLALYYSCAALSLVSSVLGKTSFQRAFPMGMLWMVRLVSLAHRWALGTCSPDALTYYAWMEVVCFTGAFINVQRMPERWIHKLQPTGCCK